MDGGTVVVVKVVVDCGVVVDDEEVVVDADEVVASQI